MGFRWLWTRVVTLFFFFLILLILPIIILTVVLPVFISRFLVFCCSRVFGPKGIQGMIGGLCGLHAVDETTQKPLGNLLVALYMEEKVDLETLKSNFVTTVMEKRDARGRLQYPELHQIPTSFMGYSFWKWDPKLDASNHAKVYEPKAGEVLDEARLLKIRQELVLQPWKPNTPLWQAVIVEGVQIDEYPNGTVLFFLAHHVLMDGFSIINILVEDFSTFSLERSIAKPTGYVHQAWGFLSKLTFPIRAIYEFSGELTRGADYNDWHRPNVKLNRTGKFSFSRSVSVNYIKEIKNAHGVGFTAVLMAAICAGVRNGMKREGVRVPETVDSFTVIPMPGHPKKLTNHLTHALIRLPTGNPDPKARLHAIEKTIQEMKGSTIPVLNFLLSRFLGQLPRSIIKKVIKQKFPATLAISNFPAPNEKVRVLGTRIHRVEFEAGPMLALPLGFACLTYNGKACIFAGVDSAISGYEKISEHLIQYFEQELDILHLASRP